MSTDPREFEHPTPTPTPNQLPTVLGVGSLTPEAAARALFDLTPAENLAYATTPRWVDLHEQDRIYYRRLATAALTAAYPLMEAQAKAEVLKESAAGFAAYLPDGTGNGRAYNSHQVASILRTQAAIIESGGVV